MFRISFESECDVKIIGDAPFIRICACQLTPLHIRFGEEIIRGFDKIAYRLYFFFLIRTGSIDGAIDADIIFMSFKNREECDDVAILQSVILVPFHNITEINIKYTELQLTLHPFIKRDDAAHLCALQVHICAQAAGKFNQFLQVFVGQ